MTFLRVSMYIFFGVGLAMVYLAAVTESVFVGALGGYCLGQALSMPEYIKALELLDIAQERNSRLLKEKHADR